MNAKIVLGLGLAVLVGCGGSGGDDTESGDGALSAPAASASTCKAESHTACTPQGQLRSSIADLLRFSISDDLAKNGVSPKDSDVKFVFKTLLIENSHIYAAATIMRGDDVTAFDLTGTKFAGKPNTVQSLMEVESGSEFTHAIGIGLDPAKFACAFKSNNFDGQAPGMYPGKDMLNDCKANPMDGVTNVDTDANGQLNCHGAGCAG
jgi:hypothetical protein